MNTAFNLLVSVQDTASSADGASLSSNVYRLDASSPGGASDDKVVHLSGDAGGEENYSFFALGFSAVHAMAVKARGGTVTLRSPTSGGQPGFYPDSLALKSGDWWAWSSASGEDVASGSKAFRVDGAGDGAWTIIIVGKD